MKRVFLVASPHLLANNGNGCFRRVAFVESSKGSPPACSGSPSAKAGIICVVDASAFWDMYNSGEANPDRKIGFAAWLLQRDSGFR